MPSQRRRAAAPPPTAPAPSGMGLYRSFLEKAPALAWIKDEDGRYVFVNRALTERFGRVPEDWLGRTDTDLWPDPVARIIRDNDREVLRSGHMLVTQEDVPDPDGVLHPWRALKFPISGLDGRRFVGGMALEMGEHLRIERELLESETRLRAIVNTAADGIITIDERGRIEWFNAAAERLFGWTADEVRGRNVSVLMPSPHRELHDGYISRYLATGERRIIGIGREDTGVRKDGTHFPLYLAISEMRVGDRVLFTGIVRDMTEVRRMQEELIRTRSLAAIGETAAALAHEIKNPLAGISSAVEVLREALPPEDSRRAVMKEILDQVWRLDTTMQRLLQLAHPWVPSKVRCRPVEIVDRVLVLMRERKDLARVRFTVEDDGTGEIAVDPGLVQQVLWNVALNAAQAMENDGEVRIRLRERGAEFLIEVSDTGPGIQEAARERLFQPFFTTKRDGSGLGLAICRKIMVSHAGSITLESEPGRGTLVRLSFPRSGER